MRLHRGKRDGRVRWLVLVAKLLVSAAVIVIAGAVVLLVRRRRNVEPVEPEARVCPSCARRFPAEARFCAGCATPLAWIEGELLPQRLGCSRCDRLYDSAIRFCPVDAEELVRVSVEGEASKPQHCADLSGADMICPVCAARWEERACYCGRDGARLQPLH